MKILVLNGSPRKSSNTIKMTDSFLDGYTQEREAHIKKVSVIEKRIKPCMGCMRCWFESRTGYCVIKDDMNDLLDDMVESDIIIWSFPLYFYGIPSHLKSVLDRTIPLMHPAMIEEGSRIVHPATVEMSNKKNIVISGCGYPHFNDNYASLRMHCDISFPNLTLICVSETPLLEDDSPGSVAGTLLDKFIQAGKEFAVNNSLSDASIKTLETPMMPIEQYLAMINAPFQDYLSSGCRE